MTGSPHEVDFVVADAERADAPGEVDEELREPGRRGGATSQRRALAAAAVALVAAALVARAVTERSDGKPAVAPSSSVSASPTSPARTVLVAPPRISAPARPLPPQFRPAGCPPDAAACATTYGLPDAALDALLRAFPHAALRESVSLLAQRAGRFGPDLVSRAFHAQVGSTEIAVYISKPSSTRAVSRSDRTYGTTSTTTSLRQSVPGFLVSIDVIQPARNLPVALDYLVQLANDDALVIPQ